MRIEERDDEVVSRGFRRRWGVWDCAGVIVMIMGLAPSVFWVLGFGSMGEPVKRQGYWYRGPSVAEARRAVGEYEANRKADPNLASLEHAALEYREGHAVKWEMEALESRISDLEAGR